METSTSLQEMGNRLSLERRIMSAGFELRGPTPYRCYIEKRYTVMAQSEAEAELKATKLLLQDLSGDLEQFTIVSEADESKKEGTHNARKKTK